MKMPGKAENKIIAKGMAKAHKQSGDKSVGAMEMGNKGHVGSCNSDGIRFKVPNDHPDKSKVRSL
jgi:hypothetical protein